METTLWRYKISKYQTMKANYFTVEPMNLLYSAYLNIKTTLENQFSIELYSGIEFKINNKVS